MKECRCSSVPPSDDDVDDDGCSHDGGDGIEGDYSMLSGQEADEIAQQGNSSTAENRGWQQRTMVLGGE